MAKETAGAAALDFTNVKEGSTFNKKRQPEGDYKGKVTKVVDAPSKKDGVAQWLFTIEINGYSYPYYCKHQENQLWKIRNLLVAVGLNVPKKRVKVDPNKAVGKFVGVTLEDDEYDGKAQSNIAAIFPPSELDSSDDEDDADDAEEEDDEATEAEDTSDDDEEEDEEPTPPPARKKKPAPVEEEDDDELEEIEIEDI